MLASVEWTDQAVIEHVLAGETALFEVLMRRYNQRLYRLLRAWLLDPNEAEDVLQEAYVRAFEHLAQFQGRSSFSTWLTRIAVNEARARIRRRCRRDATGGTGTPLEEISADGPPPEQRACATELRQALVQAIESLPGPMRAVFTLRHVEGLGTQETAECLGITAANVKVRLLRARREMRRTLEQSLGAQAVEIYAFDGERCDRIVHNVMARIR